MLLKRRTRRKLFTAILAVFVIFVVLIAGASARDFGRSIWTTYPPISWFFR